jgi:hypothetical protein
VLTPDWKVGEGGAREEVEWVGERRVDEVCEV